MVLVACSATDPQVTRGTSVEDVASTDVEDPADETGPDSTDETSPQVDRGSIDWSECDDEDYAPGVECATLDVPLDHDDPSAGTITLAVTRLPASDEAVGSIIVNPGGPGGSGNDMVGLDLGFDASRFGDLSESYDFVGLDPRGVGDSSPPIDCVDDAWLDSHALDDPTPDTPDEVAQLAAAGDEFAAGCVANTPGLAEYDTLNTARDIDLLRQAVGDEQLTFYGASYGTFLGGVYATLFPDNVRALVLDGAVYQTGLDFFESSRIQILGFEQAFGNWAADCQDDTTCPFHTDDVGARWLALRAALDTEPVPGKDGRLANERAVVDATFTSMYQKDLWGPLANALAAAEEGDGTALLALTDLGNEREADGTWSNLSEAFPVLSCTSGLDGPTTDDIEARVAALVAEAPHLGLGLRADDFTQACAGLPTATPTEISYSGSGPVLVIGGQNDPATPFVWAGRLQEAMGAQATVLTFTGEGHTSLGSSSCVTEAVERVLGGAETIEADTVCDPDPPTPAPDWLADAPEVPGTTPFPFEDAAGLFGFPDGTYVSVFTMPSERDGAADAVSDAFDEGGWSLLSREDLPIIDELDGTALFFSDDEDEQLQVIVLGPDILASPDFGTIGSLVPTGTSMILYIVY